MAYCIKWSSSMNAITMFRFESVPYMESSLVREGRVRMARQWCVRTAEDVVLRWRHLRVRELRLRVAGGVAVGAITGAAAASTA